MPVWEEEDESEEKSDDEEEEEDSWNRTAKVFSFLTTGAGKSMMCTTTGTCGFCVWEDLGSGNAWERLSWKIGGNLIS
jgi:hypothetical protein